MRVVVASFVLAMASAGPAFADVKAGVDAWQRGQYAQAVTEWRGPAAKGDADAQFNLAQAYKLGRGVPADLKIAQDWYRKAATQGHEQAQANLGLILFQSGDRKNAMPYLQKAAERGEPRAQYVFGTALFNGDLVPKDWPRAYAMMTRANAAGLPQASGTLAQMDQYIRAADRQQGAVIARQWEQEQKFAQIGAKPLPPSSPAPATAVQATPPAPSASVPPPPAAAAAARPVKPVAAATPPKAKPVPKPAATAAVPGGKWRVQLGAYGDAAAARGLWSKLAQKHGALSGLQPYVIKAGSVNRLQGGPLASKAAAEKVCAALKPSGQACFPISS
jgi:cell division protein FtsN